VVCAQLMEKNLGPDERWRSPNQIELKMYSLVSKVFNKFQTLKTDNDYIRAFRENKTLVLTGADPVSRKRIFRSIATIYESMLNVDEQKKAIISHKIIEVNQLCRECILLKN
jgi:hypothetical protein